MLTACDVKVTGDCQGESDDTFRIVIWEEDGAGGETVVYDNGFNQRVRFGYMRIIRK